MLRSRRCTLLLALALCASCYPAHPQSANDLPFADDLPSIVKFSVTPDTLIVVPVSVNDQGPFDFILDTGSSRTLIDQKLADQLALPRGEKSTVVGVQTKATTSFVHAESVSIGGKTVRSLDLSAFNHLPFGARGILGEDFMSNFDLLIDNRHRTLQIESGPASLNESLAGERLPLQLNGSYHGEPTQHRLIVTGHAMEFGDTSLSLQLDSGSNSVIFFKKPSNLSTYVGQAIYPAIDTFHSSGNFAAARLIVRLLCLGKRRVGNTPVTVPSGKVETDSDGMIPTSLFRSIFISHSGKFAILEPSVRPRNPGTINVASR